MKNIVVTILLAATLILSGCRSEKGNVQYDQPNIIFIMADDLGYADIGAFGQKIIETPRLDQLAEEGIIFTRHYAGNTVCAPSRCSLMTGKHPGHAYVRGNMQYPPSGQLPLPEGTVTVSTLLKSAGYKTGMIGKWGLGNIGNSGDPANFGWDFYYGYLDQVLAHNYYPEYLIRNGKKEYLDNTVRYLSDTLWHKGLGSYSTEKNTYSHDLFTREAIDFIKTNREGPFFLYLPYTIPHNNGEAPKDEKQEVPDFGKYTNRAGWNKETKGYAAMISRMDRDIGRIIRLLEELEIDSKTLVIFTSDNGPMPDQVFTDLFNSNGPFRGGKRDMYEGGIRVPLIAWWPGTIQAGTTSDHISAFWDFLPTACELAGTGIPEDMDGISYVPALLGKRQRAHDFLYWESPLHGFMTAVRTENWKAVQPGFESPIELYNLESDEGEQNNVADDHPVIMEKIKTTINEAHTPSTHFPRPDESAGL
ncbi:MAG: arylsulfatase [Bacteroidales bacterium]|nr:arylsulfatase [Bacteroidales bacterium]